MLFPEGLYNNACFNFVFPLGLAILLGLLFFKAYKLRAEKSGRILWLVALVVLSIPSMFISYFILEQIFLSGISLGDMSVLVIMLIIMLIVTLGLDILIYNLRTMKSSRFLIALVSAMLVLFTFIIFLILVMSLESFTTQNHGCLLQDTGWWNEGNGLTHT